MTLNPKVIDISSYQNVQDWDKVKSQGYVGVINKVTEGHTVHDKTFAIRYKPVTDRGMLYGAYHFLRPNDIPGQVDIFLQSIKAAGVDPTTILLVCDHEDDRNPLSDAKLFLKLVKEKTGQYPVLYSGGLVKDQLAKVGGYDNELSDYRLWLAQYNPTCTWPKTWKEYFLWQFTGDRIGPTPHDVQGIISDGGVDISSFKGTDDELRATWIDRVDVPVSHQSPTVTAPPVVTTPTATTVIVTPKPVEPMFPTTVKPARPVADFFSRFKFWNIPKD